MADERARDEVGRHDDGEEPDFEGHGNRGGDQLIDRHDDGEEPDFEGHGNRGGDQLVERAGDI